VLPTDWSRDGRWIVLSSYSPKTNWDIWLVPLDGSRPQAFAQTKANERGGHLSPDGRWMAFASDQEGQSEVYVQPFPATGAKWQVSVGGGRQAAWSPKGDELFYVASDSKIVAVSVNAAGASFVKGPSRVLEQTRVSGWDRTNQTGAYAVAPDGERLLVGTAVDTPLPITVVRNWPALLDRK
jgi:Tol biopolymer transport system component